MGILKSKFKVGDHALLNRDVDGWTKGIEVIITQVHVSEPLYHAKMVSDPGRGAYSLRSDSLSPVSRKEQARLLRERIVATKQELDRMKMELEILEKYPDEAAYTAHKIHEIIKSNGSEAAIAEILRKHNPTELI